MRIPVNGGFKPASDRARELAKALGTTVTVRRVAGKRYIEMPERFRPAYSTIVVAGVLAGLETGRLALSNPEVQLVIVALRRSSNALAGMTEAELGDYIAGLSAEQKQGLVNNVKGIYHELAYVEEINAANGAASASIFGATNHPGADVVIDDGAGGLSEVQLKASSSSDVAEHLERYPDIPVVATSEVAAAAGVEDSGHSNASLTTDVETTFDGLDGLDISDLTTSAVIVAASTAVSVMTNSESRKPRKRGAERNLTPAVAPTEKFDAALEKAKQDLKRQVETVEPKRRGAEELTKRLVVGVVVNLVLGGLFGS